MSGLPKIVGVLLMIAPAFTWGDDWAQFRHDAARTAATTEQFSGTPSIHWKRGFNQWPHVFAELAVVGGKVYLANMDGLLTCMSADNGNLLWPAFDTGAPIVTTPAVAAGRVHVVNLKGRLVTLDVTNGNLLWEYTVPGQVYGCPALVHGRLYFGTVRGKLYCFDAANGATGPLWTFDAGAMIDSSPCELNGKIIFAAENMKAFALNATTGALVWTAPLYGERTWNSHPIASAAANTVYFSFINEFEEPTSTYREIFSMYDFENHTADTLSWMLNYADAFVAQNRKALSPAMLLNGSTGQPYTAFTVAPDNAVIGGIPCTNWYWSSIRPCLWQGSKLYLQSMRRNILLDLKTRRFAQPNSSQTATGGFVRGDELVATSIGGNRAYGGIGSNLAYLDLTTGSRGNLMGVYGNETADATPLTAVLAADHYKSLPGDGYTDRIGTFIVANGKAYYEQYGWVYCFNGTVTGSAPAAAAIVPALAAEAVSAGLVRLTWTGVGDGTSGLIIERRTSTGTWAQVGTADAGINLFDDKTVGGGAAYEYRVRLTDGGGAYSNVVQVLTPGRSRPAPR